MFYIVDDFNVRFSEDRTILIKAPETLSGSYEVPSSVTSIEDKAFSNCANLEKVILSASITKLGEWTFAHCKNLKSIIFNSEIIEIGEYCFSECESLEDIILPHSVQKIGGKAFYECKSLKSISIPDKCVCDNCTFEQCESLYQITIPESWGYIPHALFYGCKSIEHIVIPSTIKRIEDHAFGGCSALLTVDTGNGVEEICEKAFDECENLRQIRFGINLQKIGDNCFAFCRNLHTIFWEATECNGFQQSPFSWKDYNGCIVYAPIRHCYFGHNVKHIPSHLCEDLYSLEEIIIPDNVTNIGERAFWQCNPRYIYLNRYITPGILKEIFGAYGGIDDDEFRDNKFLYCDRIEEFVVSIHNEHFAAKEGNLYNKDFSQLIRIGRKSIRSYIRYGEKERHLSISVKNIGDFAGIGLDITHLDIVGASEIGKFAFLGCRELKCVSFSEQTQKNVSADSHSSATDSYVGMYVQRFAFGDCPSLKEIHWNVENGNFPISESYQIWGWCCGERCTNRDMREYNFARQISKITVGKSVSKLPTFFSSLLKVTELELPINVKNVEGGLPPHLAKLTLLEKQDATRGRKRPSLIPPDADFTLFESDGIGTHTNPPVQSTQEEPDDDGRNFIYKDGFVISKDGLTLFRYIGEADEIIIPNSVTKIADNALSYVNAKSIIIPNCLEEIGASAFQDSNIESFVAPNSLLFVGERAFKNCSYLSHLTLNNSLQKIGNEAFRNCAKLEELAIPENTEFEDDIVRGCSSLLELQIKSVNFDLTGLTSLHKVIWDVKGEENYWSFDMFAKEVHYDSGHTYYDEENSIADQIETLIFTDHVERIPYSFAKCMQITEVDIPQSVKHIGEKAFYYCQKLEKIILHSMDIDFDEDFCHFNKTRIQLYQEFVDCTPTKIFFEGKDVTDIFKEKNHEIVDSRCRAEADAADFEQYVKDSFYGAYEGEWDPNGDDW